MSKTNKNFYLPDFILEMLNAQAGLFGGPGVVTSASIMAFCEMSDAEKKKALKKFREREIDSAFSGNKKK